MPPPDSAATVQGHDYTAITVCVPTTRVPCTKVFTETERDPSITLARKFHVRYLKAPTISDLYSVINRLAARSDCFVIRGALKPGCGYDDKEGVARQTRTDDAAFCEVARRWVALDVDDIYAPAGSSTEVSLEWLRDKLGLRDTSHVCQLTSKYLYAGRKANALRVRLWLLLDRPLNDRQAKAWAHLLNERFGKDCGTGSIDRSLFNPVQPHFVNNPVFQGIDDPVPVEQRVTLHTGEKSCVTVPMDAIEEMLSRSPVVESYNLADLPPPQEAQIAAALERMGNDVEVADGDRHRKMMGWIGELIAIGAEPGVIHAAAEDFMRTNGREPTSTEIEDAITWMLRERAETGALTTSNPRAGTEFGEVPDLSGTPSVGSTSVAGVDLSDDEYDYEDEDPEASADPLDDDEQLENNQSLVLPGNNPRDAGTAYMRLRMDGGKDLVHFQGTDWFWHGSTWRLAPEDRLPVKIYRDSTLPIKTARQVADNIRAARMVGLDNPEMELPFDLRNIGGPVPRLLGFRNGLMYLDDIKMSVTTPDRRWFGIPSLDIDFMPDAKCPRWLQFIEETTADEAQARELQKTFGYLLTNDTSHQRIFQVTGQGGTGKGTFTRVLQAVLGQQNIFATTIDGIGDRFGLANAVGRSLMLIQEASGDRIASSAQVTNYMKLISGEDAVEIRRHNQAAIRYSKLPIRILLTANGPPPFRDDSDALDRRLLCFSFDRKPKTPIRNLDRILLREKEGIVNWALEGLQMLDNEGFIDPESSKDLKEETLQGASTLAPFAKDCLTPTVQKMGLTFDEIYQAYVEWARRINRDGKVAGADSFRHRLTATYGIPKQVRLDENRLRACGRKRLYLFPVTFTDYALKRFTADGAGFPA